MNKIKIFISKFNEYSANRLANIMTSMILFYFILILIIIPLFFQTPQGPVPWMQYILSVAFQAAALPILGFVSKKEGAAQAKLLEETHDAVMSEISMMKEDITCNKEMIEDIHKLLKLMEEDLKGEIEEKKYIKEIRDCLNTILNKKGTEDVL